MSYTYTFADAEQTGLKREDDQGSIAIFTAEPGNRDYAEYLTWVAEGNTADPYVYPGYEDIATARTTRIAGARSELKRWIRGNADFDFAVLRMVANSTFTIDATTESAWDAAYTLLGNFETAVNAESDVEDVRLSTIDFDNGTYNVPT